MVLLLHGLPTSSRMFRDLIPELSDMYRVIAPDYPGFGHSGVPDRENFRSSFENLAGVVDKLLHQLDVIGRASAYLIPLSTPGTRLCCRCHP